MISWDCLCCRLSKNSKSWLQGKELSHTFTQKGMTRIHRTVIHDVVISFEYFLVVSLILLHYVVNIFHTHRYIESLFGRASETGGPVPKLDRFGVPMQGMAKSGQVRGNRAGSSMVRWMWAGNCGPPAGPVAIPHRRSVRFWIPEVLLCALSIWFFYYMISINKNEMPPLSLISSEDNPRNCRYLEPHWQDLRCECRLCLTFL